MFSYSDSVYSQSCYSRSDASGSFEYFRDDNEVSEVPDVEYYAQEWDPFEAYDQERFRLDFASSECNSILTVKPEKATTEAFVQHQRSSSVSSVPNSPISSSAEKSATIHRVRSLPTPPTNASQDSQNATCVPRPLLPLLRLPSTFTPSLEESPTFVLSISDFDSTADDTDSFSVTSDADTTHIPFPSGPDCPFASAKRSLSNPDLRGAGYGERFMGSLVGVNMVTPDDPPMYCMSGRSDALFSSVDSGYCPSSTSALPSIRLSQDSVSVYSRGHSNNGSLSSLFTTTSSRAGASTPRPLPKIPVVVPDRSRWVPPSAWKNDDILSKDDEDLRMSDGPVVRPSRPLSALDFLKEDYLRQVQEIEIPQKPQRPLRPKVQRRPGSAPTDQKRPPLAFDRSPLIALDKSRPEIQNFVKFHRDALPSRGDLELAAKLEVIAEDGSRIPFGLLFREQKTVVVFIRHFWCPLCQDYMYSLTSTASQEMLRQNGLNLIVIGNGSHSMIKSYRKIFKSPFKLYTDPSLHVYNALGMTMRTADGGPQCECGEYVKHGLVRGVAMVVKNALKNRLPVWEKGGDIQQLGGEFVMGPGLQCSYAHRMHTTRSHAAVLTVLEAAGVRVREKVYMQRASMTSSAVSVTDEDSWMAKRAKSLASLRSKKEQRRYGSHLGV